MPCDAACQKIIIDTNRNGRMAHLAYQTFTAYDEHLSWVRKDGLSYDEDRARAHRELIDERILIMRGWARETDDVSRRLLSATAPDASWNLVEAMARHRNLFNIHRGNLSAAVVDELHAFSELNCHRAAFMLQWAEETHKMTVDIAGGEYQGAFVVDGVKEIRKK